MYSAPAVAVEWVWDSSKPQRWNQDRQRESGTSESVCANLQLLILSLSQMREDYRLCVTRCLSPPAPPPPPFTPAPNSPHTLAQSSPASPLRKTPQYCYISPYVHGLTSSSLSPSLPPPPSLPLSLPPFLSVMPEGYLQC